jgi:hypothetical protein
MVLKQPPRHQGVFWSRLHFLIRFVGLTGLLAACVGLVMAGLEGLLTSWQGVYDLAYTAVTTYQAELSTWLVLGGAAAFLFGLLIELLVILRFTAGRRSVFGLNAVVQVVLAAAVLAGINWYSFSHPLRFDWTRDGQFTLPTTIRTQLEQLDPNTETKVIVYQRHKTFGNLTDKPDRYDYAAERKVVEKVKDLVELFRELGGRFDVQVLDVEEEGFDDKLDKVTAGAPELRKAIDRAPENSIFIYAGGHVQQLGFNEFFLLDRKASVEANGGRGNLVLLAQGQPAPGDRFSGRGVEPFARKVLNLEERRPRVGVLVIHDLLTTEGSEDALTLAGLRKVMLAHGFDVRDVVVKKGWGRGPLEPAADTAEESKLERLDADLQYLNGEIKLREKQRDSLTKQVKQWALEPGEDEEKKLDRLSEEYAAELGGRRVTPLGRRRQEEVLQALLDQCQARLALLVPERDALQTEHDQLPVDTLQELQRMGDVEAKLRRALDDCDLLLIPRLTRRSSGHLIPPDLHTLSDSQVEAIKGYLASGKPILACLGPISEPADQPSGEDPTDGFVRLLGDLGIRLGKETVLFDADTRAFTGRRTNPLRVDDTVRVPPLDFDAPTAAVRGVWARTEERGPAANQLRQGLGVLAHSVGSGFDLRLRFPRPVYFGPNPAAVDFASLTANADSLPGALTSLVQRYYLPVPESVFALPGTDPVFLVTAEGWNEAQPFVTRGRSPHYEAPKPGDPARGTFDEKRRGPFPVGLALEVTVPSGSAQTNKPARLAVIGQGEVFVGPELSPAKERLFLQTANWLLGRDDALPRADHAWSYPRVPLMPGSQQEQLWQWGTRLGLPVLFLYLGLVVLLVRRLR